MRSLLESIHSRDAPLEAVLSRDDNILAKLVLIDGVAGAVTEVTASHVSR